MPPGKGGADQGVQDLAAVAPAHIVRPQGHAALFPDPRGDLLHARIADGPAVDFAVDIQKIGMLCLPAQGPPHPVPGGLLALGHVPEHIAGGFGMTPYVDIEILPVLKDGLFQNQIGRFDHSKTSQKVT